MADDPKKLPYTPPKLTFLGTIQELTAGPGGSIADGMSNASRHPHRPEAPVRR